MRRTLAGLSQEKLGEALGPTFHQVQKYERGANRIGASRLYQISRVLDVPVSFFYDEMPESISEAPAGSMPPGLAEIPGHFEHDPLAMRETLELVRAYYQGRRSVGAPPVVRSGQGSRAGRGPGGLRRRRLTPPFERG